MKVKINDQYLDVDNIIYIGTIEKGDYIYWFKVLYLNKEIIIESPKALDAYTIIKYYRNELVHAWAGDFDVNDIDERLKKHMNESQKIKKRDKGSI